MCVCGRRGIHAGANGCLLLYLPLCLHRYLEAYVEAKGLAKHITFNTSVTRAETVPNGNGAANMPRWSVTVVDDDGGETTETWDAVFCCSVSAHHLTPLHTTVGYGARIQHLV